MNAVKDTIKCMNEYGRNKIPFVFIIDFDMKKPLVLRVEELEENNIWVSIPKYSNRKSMGENIDFVFNKFPVEFDCYYKAYKIAKESIIRGDTFLLNLTFPTNLRTSLTLDQIFDHGKAKYKLRFKDQFVVFSPEPFIEIHGNKISSFPMKGTMDVSIKDAEKRLMEDIKEISEHNTIVDLIRNDLSMVAKKVRVERFRYIEKIKTHEKELLQTSSEISGELPSNWNESIGDILFKLLPAGSISGAPKKKTVEIIHEAEAYDRGYFTGVFGYFDGTNLDSAVMIRYIEKQNTKLIFKSGGGITWFSDCEQEYRELIDKVYVPISKKVGNPLFETIKIQNKQLQNIGYHNDRFNQTRKELFGIQRNLRLEDIIEIPDHLDDNVYKCRVIYSKENLKIEFELYNPKNISSLKLVECNDIEYNYKYLDRSKINILFESKGNCDEVLIIKNGFVTDTSYANIVFWDGKNWITPSTPLLPGTKRKKLIEEKQIIEKDIKPKDLKSFKKARIINAMIDLEDSNDILQENIFFNE